MKFEGKDFTYKVNGESKTEEEVKKFIDSSMTVSVNGLCVNFVSPKKEIGLTKYYKDLLEKSYNSAKKDKIEDTKLSLEDCKQLIISDNSTEKSLQDVAFLISAKDKTQLGERFATIKLKNISKENAKDKYVDSRISYLLKEVDKHQQQNGREEGVEFPFEAILTAPKWVKKDLEWNEQKIIENWNKAPNIDLVMADALSKIGKKESKTVEKAPIFTYCKQMKNAMEALALRSLYGHKKYEKGDDWENFSRVENGEFEYANAQFRHALGIGEDDEKDHLIANAWNAVSLLEIYLRKKIK